MAYARQSQSAERNGKKLELPQHVLKFLRTTSVGKDLNEKFHVSLEFVNDENGICTGTVSGADVAMLVAKKIIEQKVETFQTRSFSFLPEQCVTVQTVPHKMVISKFRDGKVWAGWHVCVENSRVDICSDNMENVDKAYSIIQKLANVQKKSLEEIPCTEDRLRYLKAKSVEKLMREKYSTIVKFDFDNDKLVCSGEGTTAHTELQNILASLCRESVLLNPLEQKIARTIGHKDIIPLLKGQRMVAGWSFKEGYLSVCSDSGSNVAKAKEIIYNLIGNKVQPGGKVAFSSSNTPHQNYPNPQCPPRFPPAQRQPPPGIHSHHYPSGASRPPPFEQPDSEQRNSVQCWEHVQKYLKGKGTPKLLEEKYGVKLEFDSANNEVRLGQRGNCRMAREELESMIKFSASDSSPLTKQQQDQMETLAHKEVISQLRKSSLVAGYVVRTGRLWVCSDSPSNTAKALEVIIGMLLEVGASRFSSKASESGPNRSVGQPSLIKIDASIEKLRYLKAIGRDKNVSKKYDVEVRMKDSSRVIQVSSCKTERVHQAEKELKHDIELLTTIAYPKEQIWIQCLKSVKYADIVQALKSSGVSAGWDFKEDEFVVCGENEMAAENAAGAIESLAKQMAYPGKGKLSNTQLKSCETDKWFEVEDKLKEDNVHIRIDHSLAQIVFAMPSKQRDTAIIRRLQNFFDPHTQQKVTQKLSSDEAKLLKLNKNVIEDGCQLPGADNVLISFAERSCQLESCSTKSLDHAQQKLTAVIQGIRQEEFPVDKTALIAWLESDAGCQKLEDLSSLTRTINKMKKIGRTEPSSAKPTLQVVDGDISTITADGILTGRGILQQTVEKAYSKKLQPGIDLILLANGACRYVYHVENGFGEKGSTILVLKKSVIEALEAFSHCGVKTVALPAIGTGNLGFPLAEMADVLVSAVKEFVKSNPQSSLQTVTLVSYQDPNMTTIFKAAVQKADLMAQPKVSQRASVKFLGLDEESVKKAVKRLKDEMNERWTSCLRDISRLSQKEMKQIAALARDRHVDMCISDANVTLTGLKDDVFAVTDKISELRSQLADASYPTNWCKKAVDSRQMFVPLDPSSTEYKRVKDFFLATSSPHNCTIIEVSRVQNVEQHVMYEAYKTKVSKEVGPGDTLERGLWHGTDASSVQKICESEFNRSYAGKNAVVYGQGSYFSTTSSYSIGYSKGPEEKYMILAKVVTGKWVLGNSSMKTVPEGYHSTADSQHSPTIFVVYKDPAAYPAYLIKFTC